MQTERAARGLFLVVGEFEEKEPFNGACPFCHPRQKADVGAVDVALRASRLDETESLLCFAPEGPLCCDGTKSRWVRQSSWVVLHEDRGSCGSEISLCLLR